MSSAPWQVIDTVARACAWLLVGGLLVDQLSELLVDLASLMRGRRTISLDELERTQRKRVAVLVTGADLIEHNLDSLGRERDRFTLFCAVRPGELDDRFVRRWPHLRAVNVGGTTPGAVLAELQRAMERDEERCGPFDVVLVHGAGDVIHPLSLRLASLLIPTHQLVQIPALALAGTRAPRDLLLRQRLGGTGLCLCRHALAQVTREHGGFDERSAEQDGGIGRQFRLAGKRLHFARRSVGAPDGGEELIATRQLAQGLDRTFGRGWPFTLTRAVLAAGVALLAYGFGRTLVSANAFPLGLLGALVAATFVDARRPASRTSGELLRARRQRLDEILSPSLGLRPRELDAALALQRALGRPIEEVLALAGRARGRHRSDRSLGIRGLEHAHRRTTRRRQAQRGLAAKTPGQGRRRQ
jgi:hypothetical protein